MLREYVKPFAGVICVKLDENIADSKFSWEFKYSTSSGSSCYDSVQEVNLGTGLTFEEMSSQYDLLYRLYADEITKGNYTNIAIYMSLSSGCRN